jgi:hypothetical protein
MSANRNAVPAAVAEARPVPPDTDLTLLGIVLRVAPRGENAIYDPRTRREVESTVEGRWPFITATHGIIPVAPVAPEEGGEATTPTIMGRPVQQLEVAFPPARLGYRQVSLIAIFADGSRAYVAIDDFYGTVADFGMSDAQGQSQLSGEELQPVEGGVSPAQRFALKWGLVAGYDRHTLEALLGSSSDSAAAV